MSKAADGSIKTEYWPLVWAIQDLFQCNGGKKYPAGVGLRENRNF